MTHHFDCHFKTAGSKSLRASLCAIKVGSFVDGALRPTGALNAQRELGTSHLIADLFTPILFYRAARN